MRVHFFKPSNSLLAKYIEGYYFIRPEEPVQFSYYTIPNNFQIVSLLKNSQISTTDGKIVCEENNNGKVTSNLTYNYLKPILIEYHGAISEITIYFKPLALNFFVENLHLYFQTDGNFIDFVPFADFHEKANTFFENTNLNYTRIALEEYWLEKFYDNSNLTQIRFIVDNINKMRIQDIASHLKISRQHLNNIFHHYLGKSPMEFKRIQRFRNVFNNLGLNLTEMTYENHYYDQSHFIKEIKKITNNLPKHFFKNIDFKTSNPWLVL